MFKPSSRTVLLSAIAGPLLFSDLAMAQTNPSQATEEAEDQTIEEVIVTARRREEGLIEVPMSVAVLDAGELERQGIYETRDMFLAVPNVFIGQNANNLGRTDVAIRGVGQVGIYVDDVFVGDSTGYSNLLVDIQRVEFLRGPQSTLFGRNAMAGVIHTVTQPPTQDFDANFMARVGDYDLHQVSASVNGGLTENLSGKISAGWRERDSYYSVRGFGDSFKPEDGYIFMGQLRYNPSDKVDLTFNIDYAKDDVTTAMSDVVRDFEGLGDFFLVGARDGDPYDFVLPERNLLNTAKREILSTWLKADFEIKDLDFTSITAYRDNEFRYERDGDGSEFDHIVGSQPVDYNQFSQEFRLFSDDGGKFNWMVGAYYFSDERTSDDYNALGADFVLAVIPELAPLLPPMVDGGLPGLLTPGRLAESELLRQITGIPITTPDLGAQLTYSRTELESTAFYGSATYRPADRWEITAGLRYTDESIKATVGQEVFGNLMMLIPMPAGALVLPKTSDTEWSPNFSVSFLANENFTAYFTYGTGFRSGGYNLAPPGGAETPEEGAANRKFDPETLTSYELGIKSVLAGGRVRLNAAVFDIDYEDFQRAFTRVDPIDGRVTETQNTTASIRGFEFDLYASITDYLTGSFRYGYLDSEYDDYPGAPINTTEGQKIVDLTGQPLPFVPENSAAVGLGYDRPFSDNWAVTASLDVQYRSEYRVTDTDGTDPEVFVDDTTLVHAAVGLRNTRHDYTVVLRGRNLGDEIYRTGLDFNYFVGAAFHSLSDPRTWVLEFHKRW